MIEKSLRGTFQSQMACFGMANLANMRRVKWNASLMQMSTIGCGRYGKPPAPKVGRVRSRWRGCTQANELEDRK